MVPPFQAFITYINKDVLSAKNIPVLTYYPSVFISVIIVIVKVIFVFHRYLFINLGEGIDDSHV